MIMCLLLESFKFFCFNNIAKAAIAVLWEIPGREAMMEITMEITMTMTAILMTMTMIMMLMIDDVYVQLGNLCENYIILNSFPPIFLIVG